MYQVALTRSAQKDPTALDAVMRRRVAQLLRSLAADPRGPDSLKLSGGEAYRVRVGDYRILHTIDDGAQVVTVNRIGHRRKAYR